MNKSKICNCNGVLYATSFASSIGSARDSCNVKVFLPWWGLFTFYNPKLMMIQSLNYLGPASRGTHDKIEDAWKWHRTNITGHERKGRVYHKVLIKHWTFFCKIIFANNINCPYITSHLVQEPFYQSVTPLKSTNDWPHINLPEDIDSRQFGKKTSSGYDGTQKVTTKPWS